MLRTLAAAPLLLVACLFAAACDNAGDKAKEIGKKIDNAVDKLDNSEAGTYLQQAKDALSRGTEPSEACTWSATAAAQNAAASAQPSIAELEALCSLDVPLMRATRAVAAAESARAEQPQAPSLTECSSDEWPKAAAHLDKAHPGDKRWSDLKARWAKACPPMP